MTAEEEKVWNLVHEFCEKLYMDIPDMARRYLMDKIEEYASQQRTEGIREGFEAGKSIAITTKGAFPRYPTIDDYLNQK